MIPLALNIALGLCNWSGVDCSLVGPPLENTLDLTLDPQFHP